MRVILADLLKLLELERIEDRIFRGESRDLGGGRVFGGQVLGQALTAASYTVQHRQVHSLHAYFLVAGDVNAPIVYEVELARDGKASATAASSRSSTANRSSTDRVVSGARARS